VIQDLASRGVIGELLQRQGSPCYVLRQGPGHEETVEGIASLPSENQMANKGIDRQRMSRSSFFTRRAYSHRCPSADGLGLVSGTLLGGG
jgi:hypothetical protein